MEFVEIAQALQLNPQYLRKRIVELKKDLEVCQQLLNALEGNNGATPAASFTEGFFLPANNGSVSRFSRDEYYDAAIAYLSKNGSASARQIYAHLLQLKKPVTYDGVAAFLRREHVSGQSRIMRDRTKRGHYMLKVK